MEQNHARLTELMNQWSAGDKAAGDELFALIERELKKIASKRLRSDRAKQSFQTTEVVQEAYQQLVRQHGTWQNRTILDVLRYRGVQKRDSDLEVPIDATPSGGQAIVSPKRDPG